MKKISKFDWAVLALTALFLLGCFSYYLKNNASDGTYQVVAAVSVPASVQTAESASSSAPAGEKLDLNTATAAELETLPGIGAVRAAAIVAYREANGPFGSVDELTNVSGIGQGTLEKVRDLVTVDEEG